MEEEEEEHREQDQQDHQQNRSDFDEFLQLRITGSEENQKTYEQRLQDIFDSEQTHEEVQDNDEEFIYDGKDIDPFEQEDREKDYATRLDEILQSQQHQTQTTSTPTQEQDRDREQESTPSHPEIHPQIIIPPGDCSPTSTPSTSVSQRIRSNHHPPASSHSINGSNVSSNFWANIRIRPSNANFSRLRSLHPSSSKPNSISSLRRAHHQSLSSSTLASDQLLYSDRLQPRSNNPSISDQNQLGQSTRSNLNGNHSASSIIIDNDISKNSIFRWVSLRRITQKIYSPTPKRLVPQQPNHLLSSVNPISNILFGLPTVITIGAVIVVGTAKGWVIAFDYASNLKTVLGSDAVVRDAGAVSALSISHDHTFIAVGHIMGHIYLYDLAKPNQPARTVTPTSLKLVQEGRSEGHLLGNRIIHIDFVGLRHTAIVSADETGLAFYHALGQVLGLASTDVIRILGKYPDLGTSSELNHPPIDRHPSHHSRQFSEFSIASSSATTGLTAQPKPRNPSKIFGLLPLPLGPSAHPTDEHGLVAILTSSKLIVIALKPTPKTCWRALRNGADANQAGLIGSLSWFPSASVQEPSTKSAPKSRPPSAAPVSVGMDPLLAFSWGKTLRFITTISDLPRQNSSVTPHDHLVKDGFLKGFTKKFEPVNLSHLRFVEGKSWVCSSNILAIQWLSWRIICVLTSTHFEVIDTQIWQRTGFEPIDIRTIVRLNVFKETSSDIAPPIHRRTSGTHSSDQTVGGSLIGSFKAYKGKVFLLTTDDLRLGMVTSWADQILELVEVGSLTEAIELTTSYWVGRPDLETIGLPSQDSIRKSIVKPKLIEIMNASLEYVFSDRRMVDDTHFDLEGRGVDRTNLFEGLVRSCTTACIAIDQLDFVLETMFEQYQEHGIENIFLLQIEPFILRSQIRTLPTAITQGLISLHDERKEFDLIDLVIRNVDPLCLDINQVLAICSRELLYDSLGYVYTEAMNDFVGPIVEFLDLIKTIHSNRRQIQQYCEDSNFINGDSTLANSQRLDDNIEGLVAIAYKIFPYLSAILSGLSYPNKIKYDHSRGSKARAEVYRFIFSGQSMHWPQSDGKLILTTEEGQQEPTYPYLRTLLEFDSEAMLDSLDIGFEDSWLHDNLDREREKSINRQLIVNLLLEVIDADPEFLSPTDRTFVYIFIARNLPKYSQFLSLPSSTLHAILIGLSTDPDRSSTEDRQLAVEFLLSVYTPSDLQNGTGQLIEFFKDAGFWRILNSTYTQKEMWVEVVDSFLKDPDVDFKLFDQLSGTIRKIKLKRPSDDDLEVKVLEVLMNSIDRLMEMDVTETAILIEKFRPQAHLQVVESLPEEHSQFSYLRTLLEPSEIDENDRVKCEILTQNTDPAIQLRYISLLSKFKSSHVLDYLKSNHRILGRMTSEIVRVCRTHQILDGLVWQLDHAGMTRAAFEELEIILKTQAGLITKVLSGAADDSDGSLELCVDQLRRCALTAAEVCVERTNHHQDGLTGEDCWFYLLSSTVQSIQICAPSLPPPKSPRHRAFSTSYRSSEADSHSEDQPGGIESADVIGKLKGLLPAIVSLLITRTKFSHQISSSNLIKRLIESSSTNNSKDRGNGPSSEFRSIILMIMETYRFEGNVLEVTGRLIDEDLFEHVDKLAKAKEKGIRPNQLICFECHQPIFTYERHPSTLEFRSTATQELVDKEEDDEDRVLDSPSRIELIKKLGLPLTPIRQRSIKGKEVEQPFDYSSTCFSPSTFNTTHPNPNHYYRGNNYNHQSFDQGGQADWNLEDSFLNRGDPNPLFPPSPFLSGPPFRASLSVANPSGGPSSPLSPSRKLGPSISSQLFKAPLEDQINEHPPHLDPSGSSPSKLASRSGKTPPDSQFQHSYYPVHGDSFQLAPVFPSKLRAADPAGQRGQSGHRARPKADDLGRDRAAPDPKRDHPWIEDADGGQDGGRDGSKKSAGFLRDLQKFKHLLSHSQPAVVLLGDGSACHFGCWDPAPARHP